MKFNRGLCLLVGNPLTFAAAFFGGKILICKELTEHNKESQHNTLTENPLPKYTRHVEAISGIQITMSVDTKDYHKLDQLA